MPSKKPSANATVLSVKDVVISSDVVASIEQIYQRVTKGDAS
jgi:hypothetical protein